METLTAIWLYLIGTGTNTAVTSLFLNNILLLWLIVKITPWTWDNKIFNMFKKKLDGESGGTTISKDDTEPPK